MNEQINALKSLLKGSGWGLQDRLEAYIAQLEKESKGQKQRTSQQNKSLHLYYKLVSDALNERGWSVQKLLQVKSKVDIDWNDKNFKEIVWREIQKAVLGKDSTTELKKQEDIDKVYDHINRFLSEEPICVHVPFPSVTVATKENDYLNDANSLRNSIEYPNE